MINEKLTNKQIDNISTYIKNLNTAKNKLIALEEQMNLNWKADEIRYINNALNKVRSEINEVTKKMSILQRDIAKALKSIKDKEMSENISN